MDSSIVFASDAPASTISDRLRRGALVRLAVGVYATDVVSAPTAVVAREWHTIAGRLFPSAVVTDRSGPTGGPVGGVLYLAHQGRERTVDLPGLTVTARSGAGPVDGDIPLPGGLYQASKGRALAENTRPSRSRGPRVRRTLTEVELGDWVDRLCQLDGAQRLVSYGKQAAEVAADIGASEREVALLRALLGAAVGTHQVAVSSRSLRARQLALPCDQGRMRLFQRLIEALRQSAPQNRPVADLRDPRHTHLPFFEAYFSNFIEGTEFELDEAVGVVYEDRHIPARAADSHDLLGTYRVVADIAEMTTVASNAEDFLAVLRSRHATMLGGRQDQRPGHFKDAANRAGESLFVLPDLVPGTLIAGWARLIELDTAFERAVFMMFLVAEVHPFHDGNGRIARVMMNAELVAAGQTRIIVPTVFRDDYLGGLRRLTRQEDPSVLIKALRYAHDYTSRIDFTDLRGATEALRATNAFNEPASEDRLRLPQ